MNPVPSVANIRAHDLVARADGTPIIGGTVNLYVIALTGDNAGKWFRGADQSWQAAEAIAVAGTFTADGHWYGSVHADCWVAGVEYLEYAKESGDLHVPVSAIIRCEYKQAWSSAAKAPATLAAGDVTGNLPANLAAILGTALTETVGGYLTAAFKKLFDVATPLLVASTVMRGTDGVSLVVPDAAGVAAALHAATNALIAAASTPKNITVTGVDMTVEKVTS